MGARSMTSAQCRKASTRIARLAGYSSFPAIFNVVIHKGYCHSGLALDDFIRVQTLFHAAQGMKWAAEDKSNRRSFIGTSLRRVAPLGLDAMAQVLAP